MRNTHAFLALLTLTALVAPVNASAYLLPEEVLLNDDFYVPPAARDTRDRVEQQSEISAVRRQQEQDAAFALQHPAAPEEEAVATVETAEGTSRTLTADDLDLLRTIRLLERVDAQQEVLNILPQLHAGAPIMPNPLAPSGPGGILAAMTMLGAVGWTLKRAGKKAGWTARQA